MSKKPHLNFDEMKDPRYTYRYSRQERLERRRHPPLEEQPAKWYQRVLGNNRTTVQMLVFYIFLAVVFWFFWWAVRSQAEDKRVFRVAPSKIVEVRWISNEQKQGWNVLLDNRAQDPWKIGSFQLWEESRLLCETNVPVTILAGDYVVWFFPSGEGKPPITKIHIKVEE